MTESRSPDMVAPDLPDGTPPVDGPVGGGQIQTLPSGAVDDTISGSIAGAVSEAIANLAKYEAATLTQGSTIGVQITLPPGPDTDGTILGYADEPANIGGLGKGYAAPIA